MRNRLVMLYDLNYLSKNIIPNTLGGYLTLDLVSATLITLVYMCILLPQTDILVASEAMAASKQPRRSYDLRFELGNLDYPCIHVHIASNSLGGL